MGQALEKVAGGEVGAELVDSAKVNGVEAEVFGGLNVDETVVDEESFIGADAELVAGPREDGGVGLGDAEFAGIGLVGEVGEPGEFLAHVAEDLGDHVGENGGEDAGPLQGRGPGEHALVDANPEEDVVFDEGGDLGGGEGEAGVAGEFFPVCGSVEVAEVVVVAIAPVEALEGVVVEAGDVEVAAMGGEVGGAEDLTVVEDDGADGH